MPQSRKRRSSNPLFSRAAVDVARAALEELGEGGVGKHIGATGMSANVVTHRFAAEVPGYAGWEWNAVVACASGSSHVTINELALVPAPAGEALRAPDWVPYSERLRPGDLRPGDLLPPEVDDARLTDDPAANDAVSGSATDAHASRRSRHLTRQGLDAAKQRWRTGDYGPNSEFAEKASMKCTTCAFFLRMAEPVGENYGVCSNEFSADGILVHATYGCGAHSETPLWGLEKPKSAFDDERPIY